jgi:hypothetical protein
MQVAGHERIWAIADEDLERDNAEKTSSVHFLRFELTGDMADAVKRGAAISAGVDHETYTHDNAPVPEGVRASLVQDLS